MVPDRLRCRAGNDRGKSLHIRFPNCLNGSEMLAQHLAVMDTAATSSAMENDLPIEVFALKEPGNIVRVILGEKIGTSVVK